MIPGLLDTDTLSLLRKHHQRVSLSAFFYIRQFGQLTFTELSYYEVTRDLKAAQAMTQLADFEQFCQHHQILPLTHAAARAAGIWAELKLRGKLIGEVGVLIAGIALSQGLALASRKTRHFWRIGGLTVIDWTREAAAAISMHGQVRFSAIVTSGPSLGAGCRRPGLRCLDSENLHSIPHMTKIYAFVKNGRGPQFFSSRQRFAVTTLETPVPPGPRRLRP